jgi:hypothetical protein
MVQELPRPNSVQSLLNHHSGDLILPDGAPTRLATLTHDNVPEPESVALDFLWLETHGSKVLQFKLTPAHIYVGEIWERFSSILFLVEHFAQAEVSHCAERSNLPIPVCRHSHVLKITAVSRLC